MSNPLALVAPLLRDGEKIWPIAVTATSSAGGAATFTYPQFSHGFRVLAAYLATADTTTGTTGTLLQNGNIIGPYQVSFGLPLNDTVLIGWQFRHGTTLGVSAAGMGVSVPGTLIIYFALPENC